MREKDSESEPVWVHNACLRPGEDFVGEFNTTAERAVTREAIAEVIDEGVIRETESLREAGVRITRNMAERSRFLKSLVDDYRTPSWMKQWLRRGELPPGYEVDHIKPLSVFGEDAAHNMRLQAEDLHKIHHKYYQPWNW